MSHRGILRSALIVVSALAPAACVSQVTYDQAVRDVVVARGEAQRAKADARRSLGASPGAAELQKQASELDDLRQKLAEANGHVASVRQAEDAARAKAALYRDVAQKLHKMVDTGELNIALRDGRMVLQLPNDILFDEGRTELKPAGQAALNQVAEVLLTIRNRHFQVAGHTDDRPIHSARFKTNWELSSQRALAVLHYLIEQGARHDALSAAGYADVDPVAPNVTPEGRAKNRRTEITVQANIYEFVPIPGD